MLQYLINATEALIAAAVLIGMLLAYVFRVYGARGRKTVLIGVLIGLAAAIVMAYLKNKTKLIDTGLWNIWIFSATALALIALAVLDAIRGLREKQRLAAPVAAAVIAGLLMFYSLPDVLAYPYNIVLGGFSVFSTGFIYRFIGLVLGVVLMVVACLAVYQVCIRISPKTVGLLMKLALLVNSLQQISKIVNLLRAKRIISGRFVFTIVKFTSNHANLFIYLVLLTALLS